MTFRDYTQAHMAIAFIACCAGLIWVLVNYTWPGDPTTEASGRTCIHPQRPTAWIAWVLSRSVVAGFLVGSISGRSFWIGCWTLALCIALPWVRSRVPASRLAETEIFGNLAFGLGYAVLVHELKVSASIHPSAQLARGEFATIASVLAVTIYILRGGNHIVRGILEKGRILPARHAATTQLDLDEYNRGQIIGSIERLILLIFVSILAWSALAFLMAAKGLFRARDLEKKEYSEYFLVGTLVSSLVAIAAGLLVRVAIRLLW